MEGKEAGRNSKNRGGEREEDMEELWDDKIGGSMVVLEEEEVLRDGKGRVWGERQGEDNSGGT